MKVDNNSPNGYVLNDSLQKIVKGTGLVIISLLAAYIFRTIAGILIARNWTETDYGIFGLGYSIFFILISISSLGTTEGVVRSIAHSRGKKEFDKIPVFIVTSVFLSILTSAILGLIIYIFSGEISQIIFNESSLILPLKIIALGLPFFTLNLKIVSIFRGFEQIKPMGYFQYILSSVLFLVLVVGVIIINFPFIYVFYAYVCSGIIITIILIIYSLRQKPSFSLFSIKLITSPTAKEFIIFSIPLFGSTILGLIITRTDILMLGGFKSSADVGLYHITSPFATFISFPLNSLLITFTPIFSGLYAQKKFKEMKNNYLILTKWICLVTLPLFIVFFVFPELTISVIAGTKYLPSVTTLRLLSLAFIFSNFIGPCGATLLALGRSRFLMLSTIFAAILNIVLNFLFIPPYSYVGAATATGISIMFINILRVWRMYSLSKIHPLSYNLIKPTIFSILFIIPIYYFSKQFLPITWWTLVILFIVFYLVYILSVLFTKSLDDDDLKMLRVIEKKTGIKTKFVKKLLKKFL